tara:strand:- start:2947 stop:3636 length:690 start_codon:yes stop_codon:yes gene_type:complete
MQAVILAGGFGKRLGKVSKKLPKSLIRLNGTPFLKYQLEYLSKHKIKNVLMCLGYKNQMIKSYIKKEKFKDLNIDFSIENKPLGTGGSLVFAKKKLKKSFFFIYGDSLLDINLKKLILEFKKLNKKSLILIKENDENLINSNIKIKGRKFFYSKINPDKTYEYIDYGLIFVNKLYLEGFERNKFIDFSEILQLMIKNNTIEYKITKKNFYEIGTTSGLKRTANYVKGLK